MSRSQEQTQEAEGGKEAKLPHTHTHNHPPTHTHTQPSTNRVAFWFASDLLLDLHGPVVPESPGEGREKKGHALCPKRT